jgi:hypothetical protein
LHVRGQITYVRDAPVCAPTKKSVEDVVNQVDDDRRVNALMAAHYNHTKTPEVQIQPRDNPGDTPAEVQYSATAHDMMEAMGLTGYVRTKTLPTHLRGAPEPCLVYRRIVEDLDDGNMTIDDRRAML